MSFYPYNSFAPIPITVQQQPQYSTSMYGMTGGGVGIGVQQQHQRQQEHKLMFYPPTTAIAAGLVVAGGTNCNVSSSSSSSSWGSEDFLSTSKPNLKRTSEEITHKSDSGADVTLSRDDLLRLSSQEYEDYVQNILKQRPLTQTEQRAVKKQRRLIKNREYAQTSRNKKKVLVDQMESKLEQAHGETKRLTEHVKVLDNRIKELEHSNSHLVEENSQLKSTLDILMRSTGNQCKMTPPGSPSTEESGDVDHYLSYETHTDSEDTLSSYPPVTCPLEDDSSSTIFGVDDPLLETGIDPYFSSSSSSPSSSPSLSWSSQNFLASGFFVVFLFLGIFVTNINITSEQYPMRYPPSPPPSSEGTTSFQPPQQTVLSKPSQQASKGIKCTGRTLLSDQSSNLHYSELIKEGDVNNKLYLEQTLLLSSNTSYFQPLSIEDVFLDEMKLVSTTTGVTSSSMKNTSCVLDVVGVQVPS